MTNLNPFSELNIEELKAFSHRLSIQFPGIRRVSLYHSEWPGKKYIIIIDVQDVDLVECNETVEALKWENVFFWRTLPDLPDCIRENEENWWIEPKAISWDFPRLLAKPNTGFELYDDGNNSSSQTRREKVREFARAEASKQWAQNEWASYREIYESESMQEILKYKNGKGMYKLKWMREQIKDLNPHPEPGARKKK